MWSYIREKTSLSGPSPELSTFTQDSAALGGGATHKAAWFGPPVPLRQLSMVVIAAVDK